MTIHSETEVQGGWVFTVAIGPDPAAAAAASQDGQTGPGTSEDAAGPFQIALSWVDYEHWSHGRVAPERVVQAVVESLLEAGGPQVGPAGDFLPRRFDASTARRWLPDLDERVRARL